MSERADALADKLERVYADVEQAIESCSDDEWRNAWSDEGWSVGVTAHHVAGAHETILGIVQAVANGQPVPSITPEMLDGYNAQHAVEFANTTREDVLALHRPAARATVAAIRGLSDEQLDRTAAIPLIGDAPTSAQQLIEMGLIGHPTGHLESIRAAVGR